MSEEVTLCPECGKQLSKVAAGLYCMSCDIIVDADTGPQVRPEYTGFFVEVQEIKATYMGDHPAYPWSRKCRILLGEKSLQIPELAFEVPYTVVLGVRRPIKENLTLLEVHDKLGNRVRMVFADVEPTDELAVANIYRKAAASRGSA